MSAPYSPSAPTRAEIDAIQEPLILQFGTDWCSFCQAAEPLIEQALAASPQLRRLKIEDGPGRPLGRSFRVKLWPTLIFMKQGTEIARVVRPNEPDSLARAIAAITDSK